MTLAYEHSMLKPSFDPPLTPSPWNAGTLIIAGRKPPEVDRLRAAEQMFGPQPVIWRDQPEWPIVFEVGRPGIGYGQTVVLTRPLPPLVARALRWLAEHPPRVTDGLFLDVLGRMPNPRGRR